MSDLTVIRGDTNIYDVTIVRSNAALNLTAAKIWFTAKEDPDDADLAAAIALNSTDNPTKVVKTLPAQGKCQIALTPTETAPLDQDAYYYDIQILETGNIITTIASGILRVVKDVTRAVT